MTRKDLKRVLTVDGRQFITRGQIKKILGWGNDRTEALVSGLDYITLGRNRQYLVDDVVTAIMPQMRKGDGT